MAKNQARFELIFILRDFLPDCRWRPDRQIQGAFFSISQRKCCQQRESA
jgi:hypothetical protein